MVTRISCQVCSEHLDERDLKSDMFKCWKCGWEMAVLIREDEEDFNWIDDMLDIWLPYD